MGNILSTQYDLRLLPTFTQEEVEQIIKMQPEELSKKLKPNTNFIIALEEVHLTDRKLWMIHTDENSISNFWFNDYYSLRVGTDITPLGNQILVYCPKGKIIYITKVTDGVHETLSFKHFDGQTESTFNELASQSRAPDGQAFDQLLGQSIFEGYDSDDSI